MYEAIKNFNQQFLYEPKIINQNVLVKKTSFVVVGMGGSAHAAEILKNSKPELDILIRRDYGLPELSSEELQKKLIILSSYSGNTEETIDAFEEARDKNLSMAVISTGGKLLALAKENNIPYIQLPNMGIEPRMALGLSIKAFLKFTGQEEELVKISRLVTALNPVDFEEEGKTLAMKIKNYVPVIYASNRNFPLAYIWKIKINENSKIPTFYNVLPELNHNEMNGFDVADSTKELDNKFYFIVLRDSIDNPKILKRMEVLEKMYKNRNLRIEILELKGEDAWYRIFSSLVLADWFSYYTAFEYGLKPEQVPMVEEFKKLILE